MKIVFIAILSLSCCMACTSDVESSSEDMQVDTNRELTFDKERWRIKDGEDYPFRESMLYDVVYNDTVRTLNKEEILELLGEPSYYRDDQSYLYYEIAHKRLFSLSLHTKTMVVKLSEDDSIDWIKIHE